MSCEDEKRIFCKKWVKNGGAAMLAKNRLAEIERLNAQVLALKNEASALREKLFDKMYVVFTDYTKREERRVEAIKREKDPILFGTFQDTATRTVVERFYFIGDWTDEYCDLTLDKMVAVVKEKADRDNIKKFSTPESIRELSDQLNNLDESMNGLYRQREKAPAPKKGFFDRVRTAFRSLKGE